METLTIGKLAKRVGVNVETIRFYERKGIIAKPPCSTSGYRQYSEKLVKRLNFVRRHHLFQGGNVEKDGADELDEGA